MYKSLISQFTNPAFVVYSVSVLAVLSVGYVYLASGARPSGSYVHPEVGTVVESVETSGTVKAADSIDLSFQLGGRVAYAGPKVGTHVAAGAMLASLVSADLSASLSQAKAALAVQQAKLDGLKSGARAEDIAVSQAAVSAAESALLQAKQSVLSVAQDAYIKSDDAIHNKVDQFITGPRTASPALAPTLSNTQLKTSIESGRLSMESLLSQWQSYVNTLAADTGALDVQSIVAQTRSYLAQVGSYLDIVESGLTSAIPSTEYPAATIQGYETNVTTARTNISADVTSLNSAEAAEKAAESALTSAQSLLTLKQAPAAATDIAAQEAQVQVAQASVDAAQAQLGKSVILAPISGTITRNDAHTGATALPSTPLIMLNSDSAFQIETFVSEADVAKVKAGQSAQVTVDAYRNSSFSAHVLSVDPATTVQNGVSAYKVTLQFDANDSRVQAGMTGSVVITTALRESVLYVPSTAVIQKSDGTYVLREGKSGDELVKVVTGISGGGKSEIVSGISAADSVRSFGNQ
jgi:RND family efflux transporter MFP subunit